MYLNYPLVPNFPITLRYGEERDRDYLAGIFRELWAKIPAYDQESLLTRGYGQIDVDIVSNKDFNKLSNSGGNFFVKRGIVDSYPRESLLYHVAHKLAVKVDDIFHPNPAVRQNEPRGTAKRRITTILERRGYPPSKPKLEYTQADEERIRANHGVMIRPEEDA